jgi:hypothetical protein
LHMGSQTPSAKRPRHETHLHADHGFRSSAAGSPIKERLVARPRLFDTTTGTEHVGPRKSEVQMHVISPDAESTHDPPFRHGDTTHDDDSEETQFPATHKPVLPSARMMHGVPSLTGGPRKHNPPTQMLGISHCPCAAQLHRV